MPLPTVNPNKDWQQNVAGSLPINSTSLAQTPPVTYSSPPPSPIYPVASLDPASTITETAPEKQANDLSSQLQDLNNQLIGESSYRTQQETAQDITGKTQAVNDLSARLTGLKNEALAIPLQLQNDVQKGGAIVTAGGLQPHQTALLRNNAIQALSTNSLLEAARGNLTTAMDLADRAVKQRFDPIREQIDATSKNLNLIMNSPAYSLADKKRAAQQLQLQEDRKRALDNQEEDNKTAQAMAAAATKNFPNDPAAQFAIKQALALDPSDPQYLQKVFALVGQYQVDPQATAAAIADLDYKRQQIAASKASVSLDEKRYNLDAANSAADRAYKYAQIANLNADTASKNPVTITAQKQSELADNVSLVNNILNSGNIKWITGANTLNPFTHLPGNAAAETKNQATQLKAILSLDNRQKLKGSGAISDFESRTLQNAASSLGGNLSPAAYERELKKIRGVFTTASGGQALVKITDPKTKQSKIAPADRSTIDSAALSGYLIEYQ